VTEEWKKYIMRSFMVSICYGTRSNKIKEVEMGGACGTHGEEEKCISNINVQSVHIVGFFF
jgi:hypothetical protein